MDSTILFGTIHESRYTILANFYFYLQYFQQKVFNFKKISISQLDTECPRIHSTQDYKKISLVQNIRTLEVIVRRRPGILTWV